MAIFPSTDTTTAASPRKEQTSRDRLDKIALHAVRGYPKATQRKERVEYVTRHVRDDIDLLWALLGKHRDTIIGELLSDATKKRQAEVDSSSVSGSAARVYTPRPYNPIPVGPQKDRGSRRPNPDHLRQVYLDSMLYQFKINGQALGELSIQEVHDWWTLRKRDNRFVELILAGTNHLAPETKVKEHITPAMANVYYKQAEDGK